MRTASEAVAFAQAQITHPSQSWAGLCQSFVRHAHGVPAWAPSAYDAWLKIPAKHQHHTPYEQIPAGAAIYYKRNHVGAERPGHVVVSLGDGSCVSNDIYRHGMVDQAPAGIFIGHWNMTYLGWSLWTPAGMVA